MKRIIALLAIMLVAMSCGHNKSTNDAIMISWADFLL